MPIITFLSFQFIIHFHFLASLTTKIPQKKGKQPATIRIFIFKSSGACGLGGKDWEREINFSSTGRYVVYRVKLVACPPTL